ncbi:MAG: NUDIX domain-containing protein [Candidatus Bathyarchaeia archaeon]
MGVTIGRKGLMDHCEESDYLPTELYNQITKCLPIVSVEAVIVIDNALLLLKRNNEPAKNKWWFPGGRIRRNESLKEALRREIKEETGLEISQYKLIDVYSRVFPERHDITIAYLCRCKDGKITLDDEHSEYTFFDYTNMDLHPYLVEVIEKCKADNIEGLFARHYIE